MGITPEPRDLMKTACAQYVQAKDEEVCCAFGGSFSIKLRIVSGELLKRKLDDAAATGAELLVMGCRHVYCYFPAERTSVRVMSN
jgi:Fe-S oxidoreductase